VPLLHSNPANHVATTPSKPKLVTGQASKAQYELIGEQLFDRVDQVSDINYALKGVGLRLPNLGSIRDPDSTISMISKIFTEKYSSDYMFVRYKRRGTNESVALMAERYVHHAFGLLVDSVVQALRAKGTPMTLVCHDMSEHKLESGHKPDYVFTPDASFPPYMHKMMVMCELKSTRVPWNNVVCGQVCSYVNEMWRHQPRTHCIALASYKGNLGLFANTRGHMALCTLGKLPFVNKNRLLHKNEYRSINFSDGSASASIARVIAMILTLTPQQCGLLVPQFLGAYHEFAFRVPARLHPEARFPSGIDPLLWSPALPMEVALNSGRRSTAYIISTTPDLYLGGRVVYPTGSLSWVNKADIVVVQNGLKRSLANVVVKLQWRHKSRNPEYDVYPLLESLGVPHVPKFLLGAQVQCANVPHNYSCDLLVVEDAGCEIGDYIYDLLRKPSTSHWRLLDI
ncbi:hypothetical protein GGI12_005747, partial [Dipsacomyces acuminosporus]